MNHPTNEEWLSYLDGEASAETQARLSAHLDQCPACAAQVGAWRRTIQKLQNLSVPERQPARRAWRQPVLKWAIAAAFTLCAGLGLGRLTTPSAATIKSQALAQLRQEIQTDLLIAVAPGGRAPSNDFQKTVRANFEDALASAVSSANSAQQQSFQEALQKVQRNQDQNQRALLLLLERVQSQHAADVLALRNDLETAVSTADNDLRLNSRRLTELAATVFAKSNSTQQ
jgi:anti-sigma factor RsiW